MSGLRDELAKDLDNTLRTLQDAVHSTSELFINLPEPLAGTVNQDIAAR